MMWLGIALWWLIWVSVSPALAQLYRWTDDTGKIYITDNPATIPPAYHERARSSTSEADIHTDLIQAASKGNAAQVRNLLAKGADLEARDDEGKTALMWAAAKGNIDTAEVLLAKGADVNAKARGRTALTWAIREGKTDTAEALLAKGTDLEARDDEGKTALIWAATSERNPGIVEALLAKGADVNAKDKDGRTALIGAVWLERTAIVEALLAKGADPEARDNEGRTALMWAATGQGTPASWQPCSPRART